MQGSIGAIGVFGNDLVQFQIAGVYNLQTVLNEQTIIDKSSIFCKMLQDVSNEMQLGQDIKYVIHSGSQGVSYKPIVTIGKQGQLRNCSNAKYPKAKTIYIEFGSNDFEIDQLIKLCLYVRTNISSLEKAQVLDWEKNTKLDSFQTKRIPPELLQDYLSFSGTKLERLFKKKYYPESKEPFYSDNIDFFYQNKKYHFFRTHQKRKPPFFTTTKLFQYLSLDKSKDLGLVFVTPFEFFFTERLIFRRDLPLEDIKITIPTSLKYREKKLLEVSFDLNETKYPSVHFTVASSNYSNHSFLCLLYDSKVISGFQEKRDSLISTFLPSEEEFLNSKLRQTHPKDNKSIPLAFLIIFTLSIILLIFRAR